MILPLLKLNTSGGGFGHVWRRLVDDASRRCAVIDSVPIQLQRAREGVLRFGNPQRMDVVEDAARLFASMGIDKVSEVNIGALMRTGERYSLFDETADAFLGRMMRSSIGISGDPAVLGQFFVAHERIRLLGPEAVNALPLPGDASGVVDLSSRTAGGLTPADEAAASDARARIRLQCSLWQTALRGRWCRTRAVRCDARPARTGRSAKLGQFRAQGHVRGD